MVLRFFTYLECLIGLSFLFFNYHLCSFGPRESKKAMMYSDVGRLNCNVSYTTFATPVRGQVQHVPTSRVSVWTNCCKVFVVDYLHLISREQTTKSIHRCFIKLWKAQ
jgi:hypothetical protein